ncbi:MAG: lytic transglycosylase domain-containing protein [Thermoanaerobaculia bacterium]
MRFRGLLLALLWAFAAGASATVRVATKDGKRIISNDGVGESAHMALGQSDAWLVSRVAIPSLYDGLIAEAAVAYSLDPKLVKSVMLIESAFNPAAVSRKGARGLMQLMPDTAVRYGVRNAFDPAENISGGVRHLSYLLVLYGGNLAKSLAAYNAGETAVERYGGVPPYGETQLYVRKGLAAYYGKGTLGGGFGLPPDQTRATVRSQPVRVTRDRRNRLLLTTDLPARPGLRRS